MDQRHVAREHHGKDALTDINLDGHVVTCFQRKLPVCNRISRSGINHSSVSESPTCQCVNRSFGGASNLWCCAGPARALGCHRPRADVHGSRWSARNLRGRTTLTREQRRATRGKRVAVAVTCRQTSLARGQRFGEWSRLPTFWLGSRLLREPGCQPVGWRAGFCVFRPDPNRLDSTNGWGISRKQVQVVLCGTGSTRTKTMPRSSIEATSATANSASLIPDNDVHARRQNDSRRCVANACVGEPVGVDTVVVDPQVPTDGLSPRSQLVPIAARRSNRPRPTCLARPTHGGR